MARKPTLNIDALAALGPTKLAQLVLDETTRNAPFRKIVNAALAGAKGPDAVAKMIDRRLSALERARIGGRGVFQCKSKPVEMPVVVASAPKLYSLL